MATATTWLCGPSTCIIEDGWSLPITHGCFMKEEPFHGRWLGLCSSSWLKGSHNP